ncbi:hypothetical protein LTR66_016900, partial [Elasticomyces elasticus]
TQKRMLKQKLHPRLLDVPITNLEQMNPMEAYKQEARRNTQELLSSGTENCDDTEKDFTKWIDFSERELQSHERSLASEESSISFSERYEIKPSTSRVINQSSKQPLSSVSGNSRLATSSIADDRHSKRLTASLLLYTKDVSGHSSSQIGAIEDDIDTRMSCLQDDFLQHIASIEGPRKCERYLLTPAIRQEASAIHLS